MKTITKTLNQVQLYIKNEKKKLTFIRLTLNL